MLSLGDIPIHLELKLISVTASSVALLVVFPAFDSTGAGLIAIAAAGGIAFVLATFLHRWVTRPVEQLVEVAHRISSEQDFTLRAAPMPGREMGLLVDAFNEMLDQIQAHDRALESYRGELEETVEEWTADLATTIKSLNSEIEQRKKAEERSRYLAYYNVVTGLPNRQYQRGRATAKRRHRDVHRQRERWKRLPVLYGIDEGCRSPETPARVGSEASTGSR